MKYEYILFNLLVITGPLALSFDRRVRFVTHWRKALLTVLIAMVPFVSWDALVTGRHWWFNDAYTLDVRLGGLPPGEWLFFVTVPFACLFTWEVLKGYFANPPLPRLARVGRLLHLLIPAGVILFVLGKEYTGLALLALGLVAVLDRLLHTNIFRQKLTYPFLAISTAFMLIFNGYLTARPVVLYGESYQLGLRIFTIPVEDFVYGYALLLLCLVVFERLKGGRHG